MENLNFLISVLNSKYKRGEMLESLFNQVKEAYKIDAGHVFHYFIKANIRIQI